MKETRGGYRLNSGAKPNIIIIFAMLITLILNWIVGC